MPDYTTILCVRRLDVGLWFLECRARYHINCGTYILFQILCNRSKYSKCCDPDGETLKLLTDVAPLVLFNNLLIVVLKYLVNDITLSSIKANFDSRFIHPLVLYYPRAHHGQ